MVLLTFRKHWKDKLISREKMQTIRTNVDYWMNYYKKGAMLHIYCPNPRFHVIGEESRFIGETRDWIAIPIKARDISDEIAQRDGFKNRYELMCYLEKYGLYWTLDMDLVIIRWFNLHSPRGILELE